MEYKVFVHVFDKAFETGSARTLSDALKKARNFETLGFFTIRRGDTIVKVFNPHMKTTHAVIDDRTVTVYETLNKALKSAMETSGGFLTAKVIDTDGNQVARTYNGAIVEITL